MVLGAHLEHDNYNAPQRVAGLVSWMRKHCDCIRILRIGVCRRRVKRVTVQEIGEKSRSQGVLYVCHLLGHSAAVQQNCRPDTDHHLPNGYYWETSRSKIKSPVEAGLFVGGSCCCTADAAATGASCFSFSSSSGGEDAAQPSPSDGEPELEGISPICFCPFAISFRKLRANFPERISPKRFGHLFSNVPIDYLRADRQLAPLGGIGNQGRHSGDSLFVNKVNDELELV